VRRIVAALTLVVVATALACVAVVARPAPAWACSCIPLTTEDAVKNADAVFRGSVTSSDRIGHGPDARLQLRFEVTRVFKGRVYADQVVTTGVDSAGCGLAADLGADWIIFANETVEGSGERLVSRLSTSLCNGNLPGETMPSVLGRGQLPRPGASDTTEKIVATDRRVDRALQIAGLTALALLVLTGVGLAVLWRPGPRP
jgi:Tissue inhibitor of metalloproteinase